MSTKQFEVVVDGQYHALHDVSGSPVLKPYTSKFTLPSQEGALSVICKHLLAPYLRKHYPDFVRFRTHQLRSITLVGYTPNPEVLQMSIDEMNAKQLGDFCILKQIQVDPAKHADLNACRELVSTIWREKRTARQDKEELERKNNQGDIDELLKSNDLPVQTGEVVIDINAHKATVAAKARVTPAFTQTNGATGSTAPAPAMDIADEPLPPFVEDSPNGKNSGQSSVID